VDGVANVKVSLETGEAAFEEKKPVDMAVVKEKIKKRGSRLAKKTKSP